MRAAIFTIFSADKCACNCSQLKTHKYRFGYEYEIFGVRVHQLFSTFFSRERVLHFVDMIWRGADERSWGAKSITNVWRRQPNYIFYHSLSRVELEMCGIVNSLESAVCGRKNLVRAQWAAMTQATLCRCIVRRKLSNSISEMKCAQSTTIPNAKTRLCLARGCGSVRLIKRNWFSSMRKCSCGARIFSPFITGHFSCFFFLLFCLSVSQEGESACSSFKLENFHIIVLCGQLKTWKCTISLSHCWAQSAPTNR